MLCPGRLARASDMTLLDMVDEDEGCITKYEFVNIDHIPRVDSCESLLICDRTAFLYSNQTIIKFAIRKGVSYGHFLRKLPSLTVNIEKQNYW